MVTYALVRLHCILGTANVQKLKLVQNAASRLLTGDCPSREVITVGTVVSANTIRCMVADDCDKAFSVVAPSLCQIETIAFSIGLSKGC